MNDWPWREIGGAGTARDIGIVLQALDLVVPDGEGSYLAGPISTGRRYHEALARSGASTYSELIAAIGVDEYLRTVRWPNVADGERIAADLRKRGVPYLINTGPLMVAGWRGSDYMDACFALIGKKVRRVYFHPEWAYSNGTASEFLFCAAHNLPCLGLDGTVLSAGEARAAMSDVCEHLRQLSVPASKFEAWLGELDSLTQAGAAPTLAT